MRTPFSEFVERVFQPLRERLESILVGDTGSDDALRLWALAGGAAEAAATWRGVLRQWDLRDRVDTPSMYDDGMLTYRIAEEIGQVCSNLPTSSVDRTHIRVALSMTDEALRSLLDIVTLMDPLEADIHKRLDEALWATIQAERLAGSLYVDDLSEFLTRRSRVEGDPS
jgi:hypothetical protein